MSFSTLIILVLNALGLRGKSSVARALADIDTTVAKLERGAVEIIADLEAEYQKRERHRQKHIEVINASYSRSDELDRAQNRASRVAARFKELAG